MNSELGEAVDQMNVIKRPQCHVSPQKQLGNLRISNALRIFWDSMPGGSVLRLVNGQTSCRFS
jgi:hypothetical protein